MRRRRRSRDAGFSLVEVLVTVAIVGTTFVVFVGGMGASIMASNYHRRQANGQANLRNFAEAVKGATYVDCATTDTYVDAYSATPPTRPSNALAVTTTSAPTTTSTLVPGPTTTTTASGYVAPSVAPPSTNSALLVFYALARGAASDGSPTFPDPPPANMGKRWDIASSSTAAGVSSALFDEGRSSAGATGIRVARSPFPANAVSHSVSLEATGSLVLRGLATAASPNAPVASLTVAKPPGTVAGDAMFAHVALRGGPNVSVTSPAGWLLVSAKSDGASVQSLVYEKTATSNSAVSFTWTFGSAQQAIGGIASYGGGAVQYTATITGMQYWDPGAGSGGNWTATCPSSDGGLQLVTLQVKSTDGKTIESLQVVKRKTYATD